MTTRNPFCGFLGIYCQKLSGLQNNVSSRYQLKYLLEDQVNDQLQYYFFLSQWDCSILTNWKTYLWPAFRAEHNFHADFFSAHTYQDCKKIPDLSVCEETAVQVRSSDPMLKRLSVVSKFDRGTCTSIRIRLVDYGDFFS